MVPDGGNSRAREAWHDRKQKAERTSQPHAEETREERIGHRMSWLVSVNLAQARVV